MMSTPPPADAAPSTARAVVPKAVPGPSRPIIPKIAAPKPRTDHEATAAEGKGALAKIPSYAGAPRITEVQDGDDVDGDWGEELATLVKGTPEQIARLRQGHRDGKPFDPKAIAGHAMRPVPLDEPTTKDGATAVDVIIRAKRTSDDEILDDPTAPIGDLLRKVREGRTRSSDPPPGPQTARSAGAPPLPGSDLAAEERVRTEAERLSIEAVRLAEEVKAAYARAERKAALAKAVSEAATIASEALRLGQTTGFVDAQRTLEMALALERTARANENAASSGTSAPPPSMGALAQPPVPPVAVVAQVARPSSVLAIPSALPVPSMSSGPRTLPTGAMRAEGDALRASAADAESMAKNLRPTLGGLPLAVVLVMAVAVVGLILMVLWVGFG
jgi:hypothetical protein